MRNNTQSNKLTSPRRRLLVLLSLTGLILLAYVLLCINKEPRHRQPPLEQPAADTEEKRQRPQPIVRQNLAAFIELLRVAPPQSVWWQQVKLQTNRVTLVGRALSVAAALHFKQRLIKQWLLTDFELNPQALFKLEITLPNASPSAQSTLTLDALLQKEIQQKHLKLLKLKQTGGGFQLQIAASYPSLMHLLELLHAFVLPCSLAIEIKQDASNLLTMELGCHASD